MVSLTAQRSLRRRKHTSSGTRREETASVEICAEHSWVGRQSVKVHMGGAERIEPESLSEVRRKSLELEVKAYISQETTEIHWASLSRGSQCLELQRGK